MDDSPSMAKQIIHFKKGLLPSIKRKMEIREYLDLADIITQAKLVEADCINELSEEFDSGLTKGMFKRGGDNTLFLGIQEVEGSLETKREGTEILFTERVAPQSVTPPHQIQMQTLLAAIGSMQKSSENLHKGKHPQMEHTVNELYIQAEVNSMLGAVLSSRQKNKNN